MCYNIYRKGKENPKNQKGYIMNTFYNYRESVLNDVVSFFAQNPDKLELCPTDTLMFAMLVDEDDITGNRSESYFCNAYKARETLRGNEELYEEAVEAMGTEEDYRRYFSRPEEADILVRMYVLSELMNEIWKRFGKPAE